METLGLNLIYLVFLYGEVILMCSLSWLGSSRVIQGQCEVYRLYV